MINSSVWRLLKYIYPDIFHSEKQWEFVIFDSVQKLNVTFDFSFRLWRMFELVLTSQIFNMDLNRFITHPAKLYNRKYSKWNLNRGIVIYIQHHHTLWLILERWQGLICPACIRSLSARGASGWIHLKIYMNKWILNGDRGKGKWPEKERKGKTFGFGLGRLSRHFDKCLLLSKTLKLGDRRMILSRFSASGLRPTRQLQDDVGEAAIWFIWSEWNLTSFLDLWQMHILC